MANYTHPKNNAAMVDTDILLAAGIDPKTGLPLKISGTVPCALKENIRGALRIKDEQDAINRFTYYNLPKGLNGQLIERILYYKGRAILFKLQDTYYCLPYALDGSIDVYGRYTGVTPLPFNGTQTTNDGKDKPWIQGLTFVPRYEIADIVDYLDASEEEIQHAIERSCVILNDYSPQISQNVLARSVLQEPLLDIMSNCIPFMNTNLLNSTGISGMRVENENDKISVNAANNALYQAALNGQRHVGIVGKIDFQELGNGTMARAQEFMLAMQSLDNFRLSLHGIDNGGLFEKKAHMLEEEQATAGGSVGLTAADALYNRQMALTIFNSYFGTNAWVMPSEAMLGGDLNGNMIAGDGAENEKTTSTDGGNTNADTDI